VKRQTKVLGTKVRVSVIKISNYLFSQFITLQASNLKMSAAVEVDTKAALATAANEARGLAMDSIAAAHSGHMGLPLGCAEIGATLYGGQVRDIVLKDNSCSIFEHVVDVLILHN
jgi:hypothetical protein